MQATSASQWVVLRAMSPSAEQDLREARVALMPCVFRRNKGMYLCCMCRLQHAKRRRAAHSRPAAQAMSMRHRESALVRCRCVATTTI